MIEFECYTGSEGFGRLREKWQTVFDNIPNKRFFYRYEWYKSYIETLMPEEETIHFFIAHKDKRPFAIFPLREAYRKIFGVRLKTLESLFHSHIPFADIVYDNSKADKESLIECLDYLISNKNVSCDAIIIFKQPEDSAALRSFRESSWPLHVLELGRNCAFFPLKDGYEALNRAFTGKHRSNLKRGLKCLTALGDVAYSDPVEEEDLLKDLERFMDIEASGWKGAEGTGSAIKCHDRLRAFYHALIHNFSGLNGCRISLLRVSDEFIAGEFDMLDSDTRYCLKIAYREDYGQCSPGSLVMDNLLREYGENNRISFLNYVTDPQWISPWRPERYGVFDLYIFRVSLIGALIFTLMRVKQIIRPYYYRYITGTKRS